MINSELLKEAIADAKAVRATALANAKAALEEAFAPRFEAMFADKLKEESEEQEEMVAEVEAPNQVASKGGEAKPPATKAVSKGQPKTPGPAAGDKDFKPVKAGKGPADVANPAKKVNETAEEEEEGKKMDEVAEEEEEGKKMDESAEEEEEAKKTDESVNEFGLTSEDLDSIIKELEAEVAGEEEGKKEPVADPAAEVPPAMPAPEGEPTAEVPPVDVAAAPGAEVDIDVGPEAGAEEVPPAMPAPEGEPAAEVPAAPPVAPPAPEDDDDENINLEELLAALNEESEEEEEESVEEAVGNHDVGTATPNKATVKGYPKTAPEKTSPGSTQVAGKNHNIQGKGNIGTGAVAGGLKETAQYKQALKEAYKTIEFLRGQINEVNLLNAKLLYTNKLFKEFAGVLDDQYRLKIVESFDLTKSVREVKLAYALLAESLSFGTQMKKTISNKPATKPAPVKGSVKQITEGLASKPVASTKPAQVITENVNEMALRFKKLAGIKEAPKASEKK